ARRTYHLGPGRGGREGGAGRIRDVHRGRSGPASHGDARRAAPGARGEAVLWWSRGGSQGNRAERRRPAVSSFLFVTWTCLRCQRRLPAGAVLRAAPVCRCGEPMTAPAGELRRQRLDGWKLLETHGRGWKRLRFGYGARLRRQRRR